MELIDTHCHLQFDAYKNREDQVLADASRAGVKKFICPGTSLENSRAAAGLAEDKENVWAAVGVHPHEADKFLADPNGVEKLKKLAALPRVVAIGEIGLDRYKMHSTSENQEAILRAQLEIGLNLGLPFIFHIRDAWESFWPIFDDYKGIKGVIHSFSTHSGHLEEVLSRGLYVGLNGIMTFTDDQAQLEAAKQVPLERLLLETDAPFLTPAPMRNELCEPKHMAITTEFVAKLRGDDLKELAAATSANAVKLFGLES